MTSAVAATFRLAIGDSWPVNGRTLRVVGIVENPKNLQDAFALVAPGPDQLTVQPDRCYGLQWISGGTLSSAERRRLGDNDDGANRGAATAQRGAGRAADRHDRAHLHRLARGRRLHREWRNGGYGRWA
jgi:hypothetical protein